MKQFLLKICLLALTLGTATQSKAQSSCTASFIYSVGANGNVTFSSTSTGTTASTPFYWSFGNGAPVYSGVGSAGQYASATYTINNTFVVNLSIGSSVTTSCYSSTQQTISITTTTNNCLLQAGINIIVTPTSNVVLYESFSTGTVSGTTYQWSFSDGGSSTSPSVYHTYTTTGQYGIQLGVDNNTVPTCTANATTMLNQCSSVTNTLSYVLGPNGQVSLFSPSTGTTSATTYTWNLNGAIPFYTYTSSSLANPVFTLQNGVHDCLLFSQTGSCLTVSEVTITVTNNPCVANANFTMVPTTTAQVWNAIPASTASIAAASWDWGDWTTSNTLFTSHTYSAAGTYDICLSTTLTCGGMAYYCFPYYISKSASDAAANQVIQVNVVNGNTSTTGIANNIGKAISCSVFPNPTSGNFTLQLNDFDSETASLKVTDISGRLIYFEELTLSKGALKKEINFSSLSNGVFFLKVESAEQNYTQKLIITK